MGIFSTILNFIGDTALLWIPIILGIIFWYTFRAYQRQIFVNEKIQYVLLEINIPKDVFKSPQAMELVIDVLSHLGGGAMAWQDRFWFGAVLMPSSLEIISIEGSIYFFIRANHQIADLVKSTIYSQYPNAEVNEVDDYTRYVPDYNVHQDSWDLYGVDFKLAQDDFLPIKTYVDYGLDKAVGTLDEEQKIDPITPLLEYLGTLRSGEQIWIQFIVRSDQFSDWRKRGKAKIEDIMGRGREILDDEPFQSVKITHGEQEQIKAIEKGLSKHAFETVIRAVYIAKKENFSKVPIGFFKNPVFKPFNSLYLNSIFRNLDTTTVDWIWQDITGLRTPALKRRFFNDYVNRAAFYEPFWKYLNFLWYKRNPPMIFTSEELATLFHIPGRVSETSNLERIDAKKSEAPTNLPI